MKLQIYYSRFSSLHIERFTFYNILVSINKKSVPNFLNLMLTNKIFFESAYYYLVPVEIVVKLGSGNTKGGSITVPLTSCLTGLD